MFVLLSEIGFLTYWWIFIIGLMAVIVGLAIYAQRPKEKIRIDVEVLTVKSAQVIWVIPPPPSPPSRPMYQPPNAFTTGAQHFEDMNYHRAMMEHEYRLQRYYEDLAEARLRAKQTGEPVGYPDHTRIEFEPYGFVLKAELGGKYKPGDAWRVSIRRGETSGEIYSFEVLERADATLTA